LCISSTLFNLPKFDKTGEQNLVSAENQLPVFGKLRTTEGK